jgi:hypothetical protein
MHSLAAELIAEYLGVLLIGEHEHLIELVFGHYRVPVTRQRQPALLAEIMKGVEVLADALLLFKRDPIPAGLFGAAKDAPVDAHRKRLSIGPLMALLVPEYLMRCSLRWGSSYSASTLLACVQAALCGLRRNAAR